MHNFVPTQFPATLFKTTNRSKNLSERQIMFFGFSHTTFVWTVAKVVWKIVWTIWGGKVTTLARRKAPREFRPNKKKSKDLKKADFIEN